MRIKGSPKTLKCLKTIRGDLCSTSTALSRPLSSCHARLKFGNSKFCILKAKDTTGLKTC